MQAIDVSIDELRLTVDQLNLGITTTGNIEGLTSVVALLNSIAGMLEAMKAQGSFSAESLRAIKTIIDPIVDFMKVIPKLMGELKTLETQDMITISIQTFYAGKRLLEALGAFAKKPA